MDTSKQILVSGFRGCKTSAIILRLPCHHLSILLLGHPQLDPGVSLPHTLENLSCQVAGILRLLEDSSAHCDGGLIP
jgi:hypothetical protein